MRSIADREIDSLPDVATTLADLYTPHQLILVTKGDPMEQTKLNRSGVADYFHAVEVLPETLGCLRLADCAASNRAQQYVDDRE